MTLCRVLSPLLHMAKIPAPSGLDATLQVRIADHLTSLLGLYFYTQ